MKKIVIKLCFIISLIVLYNLFVDSFFPVVSSQVALTQLEDSTMSFINFNLYNAVGNYSLIVLMIVILFLFYGDIKKLINKIQKGKNEKI